MSVAKIRVFQPDGSWKGGLFKSSFYDDYAWPKWTGKSQAKYVECMYYMRGEHWMLVEWAKADLRLKEEGFGEPFAKGSAARWQSRKQVAKWFEFNGLELPPIDPRFLDDSMRILWTRDVARCIRLLAFLNEARLPRDVEVAGIPEELRDTAAIELCASLGLIRRFEKSSVVEPSSSRRPKTAARLALEPEGLRLMAARWLQTNLDTAAPGGKVLRVGERDGTAELSARNEAAIRDRITDGHVAERLVTVLRRLQIVGSDRLTLTQVVECGIPKTTLHSEMQSWNATAKSGTGTREVRVSTARVVAFVAHKWNPRSRQ